MELTDGVLQIGEFLTVTLGIVVLFVGKRLHDAVGFLREFSIPEPVTGGLLFSVLFGIVYALSGIAVEFMLGARDILLVYFFTTIGINASLKDLLAITIAYMAVQNLIAVGINLLVVFPAMGRNYDAAVVCAGFGGISLGSTPTAMANMSAVTQRYGASHVTLIVVPLVCAFLIDLANF
jgi:ESS family glutamate:Na+ symporter